MNQESKEKNGAADEQKESTGWPGLLRYAAETFLLLRDVFGYLLAGAVLVLVTIGWSVSSQVNWNWPEAIKLWPALIVASYIAGHLGAIIGYWLLPHPPEHVNREIGYARSTEEWLCSVPMTAAERRVHKRKEKKREPERKICKFGERLYLRRLYPQLYVEYDRQETLTLFRIAVGGNFLLSALFVPIAATAKNPSISRGQWIATGARLVTGIVVLLNGKGARSHVEDVLDEATKMAARWAANDDGRSPHTCDSSKESANDAHL